MFTNTTISYTGCHAVARQTQCLRFAIPCLSLPTMPMIASPCLLRNTILSSIVAIVRTVRVATVEACIGCFDVCYCSNWLKFNTGICCMNEVMMIHKCVRVYNMKIFQQFHLTTPKFIIVFEEGTFVYFRPK